jgi:hypothetical protein
MPKINKKTLKNKEKRNKSYKRGGDGTNENYVYSSKFISTQQNTDADYSEVGIIHVSDSTGINAIREMATGFANFFGSKGFDNRVYDIARNNALKKLNEKIDERTQKVCNLRMEVSYDKSLVFVHLYGTLLQKGGAVVKPEEIEVVLPPLPQQEENKIV